MNSSFYNLISGLGTNNDQGANTSFCARKRIPLSYIEGAMRVDGIFRNIIEAAPEDAIRAWRDWTDDTAESISDWEAIEVDLDYREAVETALLYAEIYGGAVVIPSFDSSVVTTGNYRSKFNINDIPSGGNNIRGWLVYSASELKRYEKNLSFFRPSDPRNGWPDQWEIKTKDYQLNPLKKTIIHSSWMLPVIGPRALRHDRPIIGDGLFGESRIDILFDSLARSITSQMAGATSLHKANIDVFYGNIADRIDQCNGDPVKLQNVFADFNSRLKQLMMHTSTNHPMSMDKDSEKLERLGLNNSAASMDQLLNTFVQLLCAARQIPLARALGIIQTGLSNDSNSDLKHWYDKVDSFRVKRMPRLIRWMDNIISHDKGIEPLHWELGDLYKPDAKTKTEIEVNRAKRDEVYVERVGLPNIKPHIMRNLVAAGTYKFTEDQINEMENTPPEIDDGA